YARGAHSSLFARACTAQPDGQLVCFSLRGLPERLKAPALLLCLDAIWRSLEGPLRKRCVLVDEAWLLMREPAGAAFLHRLAKSARKRRRRSTASETPSTSPPASAATCSPTRPAAACSYSPTTTARSACQSKSS